MSKGSKRVDNKGRKLPEGFSQRPDGRYQARFTFNGKRYTLYDKNLVSLKTKLVAKKNELNNGIFSELGNIELNDWFHEWLKIYKIGKIKELTYDNYLKYWNRYVADTLGNMCVKDIKRVHIVTLYNELLNRDNNISPGTLKYVNILINSVLEQAVYNDIINKNPAVNILKEIAKPETKKRDALTADEEERILKFIGNDKIYSRYNPIFTTGFDTGLRIGELTALTWDDIDIDNETISVNKTLHYVRYLTKSGHHYVITSPKTESSFRIIPMLGDVKKVLEEQKEYQKVLGIRGSLDIDGYTDFVFTTSNATPYTPDGINLLLRRIVDAYNINEKQQALMENRSPILLRRFSPHIMRHSFASRCFEKGISPKVVQTILGHKKIDTTWDIYTDCSIDIMRKEIKRLDK